MSRTRSLECQPHGARWFPRRAAVAVAAAIITAASLLTAAPASGATAPFFLGDLGTSPVHAKAEAKSGITAAMMELNWAKYEPRPGVFDTGYEKQMQSRLAALQASGMRVTLGLGLHFTPGWVLSQPNGRLVDQYGNSSATANLVFNKNLRSLANAYLARANAALHFSRFWAVRITSGGSSELTYPQNGHYWAFDLNAQNGSALPTSMTRNPAKGWKPGTGGLSTAQMTTWMNWYVGALADVARWQIGTVRSLGFTGYAQIITPGTGVYARKLPALATARLPNGMLGVGAAWSLLYSALRGVKNVQVYLSSVADGSGGNVGCSSSDRTLAINAEATVWWSSSRWLKHIADLNGFTMAGEAEGLPSAAAALAHYRDGSANGLMVIAIRLAKSCGFMGFYWAHDDQFWNQTVPMSRFARYAPQPAARPAMAP